MYPKAILLMIKSRTMAENDARSWSPFFAVLVLAADPVISMWYELTSER